MTATPRSTPKLLAKIAGSVAVLAIGATALTGAFGGWTSTLTKSQSIQAGTVNLTAGDENITTSAFGTTGSSGTPIAPGDTGSRYIQLSNTDSNALPLSGLSVYVPITVNADSDLLDPDTTPATATQVGQDITVYIQGCDLAWSSASENSTCSSTAFDVGVGTSETYRQLSTIPDSASKIAIKTTSAGVAGVMEKGSTVYLKILYKVRALGTINGATAGVSATAAWTFYAAPRAALSNQ